LASQGADALIAGRIPAGVPSVGKIIDDPLKSGTDFLGNLATQPAMFRSEPKPGTNQAPTGSKRKIETKPAAGASKTESTRNNTRKKP
jgi:hypothetical protein